MKSRAKRLAWELTKVLSRYNDRDVTDAISLLRTGDLFHDPLDLIVGIKSDKKITNTDGSITPSSEIGSLGSLVKDLDDTDSKEVLDFFHEIVAGRTLKGSTELRNCASLLDIHIPKKMPSRSVVARRIVENIIKLDKDDRLKIINQKFDSSQGESALKAWSDLIVKS